MFGIPRSAFRTPPFPHFLPSPGGLWLCGFPTQRSAFRVLRSAHSLPSPRSLCALWLADSAFRAPRSAQFPNHPITLFPNSLSSPGAPCLRGLPIPRSAFRKVGRTAAEPRRTGFCSPAVEVGSSSYGRVMAMKWLLAGAAALAGLALVGGAGISGFAQDAPAPKVGDKMPDFSLPGSDGKTYSLKDFVGKRAFIIAWFPRAFTGG